MSLPEREDSLRASSFKNTLLKALNGDIVERLRLQPVRFELKHEIENPGDQIDRLYFLDGVDDDNIQGWLSGRGRDVRL
jgi:hypothetical protein